MTRIISRQELMDYMQAQRDYVAKVYGVCNEETLRQFAKSEDSRKFRETYCSQTGLQMQN